MQCTEILQSIFQDLGFSPADLAEIGRSIRDKVAPDEDPDPDLFEAVALMIAIHQLDNIGFQTNISRSFDEATTAASNAAVEAQKVIEALSSIPAELRSEFRIEGISASAERWVRLAAELGKIADLTRPKKRKGRPPNQGFRAFVLLLASRYHQRVGRAPTVIFDAIEEVYRGPFIDWVEGVFRAGTSLSEDWGYAQPSLWPPTPGARGRAIGRILRDVTF